MPRGGRSSVSRPRLVRAFAAPAVTGSLAATLPPVAGSESGTFSTAATQLAVTTQPAGAVTGVAFTTQPVVRLRDAVGANVLESGITVTAYLSSGSGTLGGTKQVVTNASGIATFTNLSITGSGSHTVSFHALMSQVQAIWSDDVEVDRSSSYFEKDTAGGRFTRAVDPASGSTAWRSVYQSGTQVSHGNLHLAFGRTPDPAYMVPVYGSTLDFGEVTAEFTLRHTVANPFTDKLFRCHVFSASNFSQAAQCHAWANGGTQLFLDPATGTNAAGTVITSGYNDFANLTFLGVQTGTAGVFGATAATSKAIKIVTRLDAPGQNNGVMQQYVDGVLDAQATGLALVKSYTGYGINACYFENFTNTPFAQTYDRYFDNILVTGRARSVVSSNSLTVAAGGSGYANEPGGYALVFAHDFQAFPSGSNGEAGTDWLEDGGHSSNLTIVTDATAPVGDTNVLRTRFPSGLAGGDTPCNVIVDQQDSARRTTQFYALDFKIEGTDYQNQATGTKFGFFSYGESSSGAMNQSFLILVGNGSTSLQSAPSLELWQQGAIADRTLTANLASSAISVGAWHRLEMLMTTNTIGSSNGLLKMWVDGVQTHNYTNVVYRNSGAPLGLAGWKWQPYWGGTGGAKSRDDFIRLARVYMSGA